MRRTVFPHGAVWRLWPGVGAWWRAGGGEQPVAWRSGGSGNQLLLWQLQTALTVTRSDLYLPEWRDRHVSKSLGQGNGDNMAFKSPKMLTEMTFILCNVTFNDWSYKGFNSLSSSSHLKLQWSFNNTLINTTCVCNLCNLKVFLVIF